ncbi:reverse transcriptase domain-containing protein [Tanacetum coccineum]|uniref:Reverse transcriptase domain-containing protein n=1 Tax=Tanacetum coccineum TaxID=301880 RepID=A0ABQ4Y755_9ASTR
MVAIQRTMAELLRAPTEGYAEAIVVPTILAEHFELKHSLINMHDWTNILDLRRRQSSFHIPRRWLEKEPPRSILTWEDLVSKFINEFFPPSRTTNLQNEISNFEQRKTTNLQNEISNFQQRFDESLYEAWDHFKDLLRACPHHSFTKLHQLDTFYNGLNPSDQDSLNSAAVKESKVDSSKIASVVASAVTSAMTAMFKQHQVTLVSASVKAIEESCVTCGGAHSYRQCPATDGNTFSSYQDNIQGYVSAAAANYNQGNAGYHPQNVAIPIQTTQVATSSDLEKIKKINEVNIKVMQAQINNVKNELRNEMQTSIQASMSNQTNELKNMMASFFQMNIASTSGQTQLPSNTIANPKGELKAITTRSGLVLDGPSLPMPHLFINSEEDERVEETFTDPELGEYTIKVPPPLIQKAKPLSQRNYVVHQRDPRHPHIPYPSRMNQEKQKEKDEVQIHKFWQMFKQLHINITLADALILIPKYQKKLKALC